MSRAATEHTRETILAEAAALMAEHGFHGMSMRRLASAVGCALSSLYNHFPSKEALLRHLQTRAFETLIERADAALSCVEPADARLYAFIDNHVRFVTEHADVMRVLVREAGSLAAEDRRAVRELKERYFAIGHAVVRGVLAGGADDAETARVTYNLFGMLNWLWGWYEPARHGDVDAITRSIHHLMLSGVAGHEAGDPQGDPGLKAQGSRSRSPPARAGASVRAGGLLET